LPQLLQEAAVHQNPGSISIRGPSELGEVPAELERLVVRLEGLDIGSLHREVQSGKPLAQGLQERLVRLKVVDGLPPTRRQTDGSEALPLLVAQRARIDGDGAGQLEAA